MTIPNIAHYRILQQLTTPAMGLVYRAHDQRLNREVAIKALPPARLAGKAPRRRFHKEALTLARLRHPNLLAIYDHGTQDDLDFLVMEPLPAATLADRLRAGPLPETETLAIAQQIAAALKAAHRHRVLHRDLKPSNVFVTPEGEVKVAGFGLAPLLDPLGAAAANESADGPGGMADTLPYMAPEQLRSQPATRRTDVYAFGALFYEMVTGRRAFPQPVLPRVTAAILHHAPLPPSALVSGVSPAVERIILKCLAKTPTARYRSGRELAAALRRLPASSESAAILQLTERPLLPVSRAIPAGRWLWLAALVTLIAVLAALFA
jgi:serine/threonine protein kinase